MQCMKKGTDMQSFRQRGFTLIELMITVVIVAILASVALPAYQEQVRRGHRAAAQTEMMDIANREQQFLLANRAYADKAALEGSGYALPSELASKYGYAIAVNNAATPPTFTITFTPSGSQTSDGALVLNSAGVKTRAGEASKW
jgi:type IV pilus assembly protein PilE